jgi:hypothetical protein
MKRLLLLGALAACGDNALPIELDSEFDTDQVRFFGSVFSIDDELAMVPLFDLPVCLDDTCTTTDDEAAFLLEGPSGQESVVIAGEGAMEVPTAIGVLGGPTLDRNLGMALVLSRALIEDAAAAYERDAGLDTGGVVLVFVMRTDDGEIQLAIGGTPAVYLDDRQQPDPGRPSLGRAGGAMFFAVPPGEATIRTTVGSCEPNFDGWPATAPGEVRVPVIAGHLTLVRPFCVGASVPPP